MKKYLAIALMAILLLLPAVSALQTVSNGYYNVYVDDTYGLFTVGTGSVHPTPNTNVLFGGGSGDPWSSYFSVRTYPDYTAYYPGGYIALTSNIASASAISSQYEVVPAAGAGSILDIERVHEIHGTTLNSSYVSISTTFTNPSTSTAISFGYLEMWDLMIANNDDAISRTIQPTTTWSGLFKSWNTPSFVALEVTDTEPPLSTFSIYVPFNSTVASSSMPDVFIYGEWSIVGTWGYVPSGGNEDSGVAFIYGPDNDNAVTLAPGGSITFTQYITTSAESMNIPVVHQNDWSPVSLLPLYRTNLASATERWSCIQELLPEDIPDDVAVLIDEVSAFMGGATSLSNPIYASGQLGRALAVMSSIEEGLDIDCES